MDSAGALALQAQLGPEDLQDVQLLMWSDADWAGDVEDTKSTSGMLLELIVLKTGGRWPISWQSDAKAARRVRPPRLRLWPLMYNEA